MKILSGFVGVTIYAAASAIEYKFDQNTILEPRMSYFGGTGSQAGGQMNHMWEQPSNPWYQNYGKPRSNYEMKQRIDQ